MPCTEMVSEQLSMKHLHIQMDVHVQCRQLLSLQ